MKGRGEKRNEGKEGKWGERDVGKVGKGKRGRMVTEGLGGCLILNLSLATPLIACMSSMQRVLNKEFLNISWLICLHLLVIFVDVTHSDISRLSYYVTITYESRLMNKKLSWCWQTRATRLELNQRHQTWYHFRYVRYGFLLVFYNTFVPKTHRFWDIVLVSIRDLEIRVMDHSRSSKPTLIDPPPVTSY